MAKVRAKLMRTVFIFLTIFMFLGYKGYLPDSMDGTPSPGVEVMDPVAGENNFGVSEEQVIQGTETNAATVGELEITFIDVGQGDAILVSCDNKYMLVDGGEAYASDIIYTVLQNRGISHLDVLVATHGHSDHVGGLSGALNYADVDTAYCSVTEYDTKTFRNMVKYLEQDGVSLQVPEVGDTFDLGSAVVSVLGPIREYDDHNDMSLVLRVDHGENSFLLTGDMEREAEKDLIESGANLDVDVLKVGHHGSSSGTCYQFLYETSPEYAVISCGEGNEYGHPHEEVMSRLEDDDVTVYRTDTQGDITCMSDGFSLEWTVGRAA